MEREKERERDLWHFEGGGGGELSGFGVDFKGSHHFLVAVNVVKALLLVVCEFLRRRHGRAQSQTLTHKE